jgi:hypothetical protein
MLRLTAILTAALLALLWKFSQDVVRGQFR